MVKSIAFGVPPKNHSGYSHSPEEVLWGESFYFLNESVLLYQEKGGGYTVFTIDPSGGYTKDDYMQLPEGVPIQLINGKLIHMPSPTDYHQAISQNISLLLALYVRKNKLGIVRYAPLDVHLDLKNIVQPDVMFISNERESRRGKFIFGAHDLVVGILSPGTKSVDKKQKRALYEKYGVLEYWIVDPENKNVEIYFSKGKKFAPKKEYGMDNIITSKIVSGFKMPVSEIFSEEG